MMEFFNKLATKIGVDKFLHLFLSGWLTQIGLFFGTLGMIIAPIAVLVLGLAKELFLDSKFEWKDMLFNLIGCSIATIISIVLCLIF